jgi:hypothetical protein
MPLKYSNKELELAFKVLSVRPPDEVINPLKIEREYISESKNGLICVNTNSAFLHGRYPTCSDAIFSTFSPEAYQPPLSL